MVRRYRSILRWHRRVVCRRHWLWIGRPPRWLGLVLTALIAVTVACLSISILEARLRPMIVVVAQAQTQSQISAVIEEGIVQTLLEQGTTYQSFVQIQRDNSGSITSLTSNVTDMNRLRVVLMEEVLEVLEGVRVSQIEIPLGSLLDFDILWGLGPTLRVHAMTVGTVEAQFSSTFSQAGVNQTLHQIYLDVVVPLTLMLPGGAVETTSHTRLCVAETVIVGQVPQFYLSQPSM